VKALYPGAGLAVVAGLLMGAAMKPNLDADDRPVGPQILAGWSGARSTGPFEDGAASFAAYSSQIPDYVIGTDWRKALAQPIAYAEPQERMQVADAEAPDDQAQFSTATYQEPPREATSFPSMDGGRWYEEQRRQQRLALEQQRSVQDAAAQVDAVAQLDDEAPPEATGDTTTN
jgi:hypothetical protein